MSPSAAQLAGPYRSHNTASWPQLLLTSEVLDLDVALAAVPADTERRATLSGITDCHSLLLSKEDSGVVGYFGTRLPLLRCWSSSPATVHCDLTACTRDDERAQLEALFPSAASLATSLPDCLRYSAAAEQGRCFADHKWQVYSIMAHRTPLTLRELLLLPKTGSGVVLAAPADIQPFAVALRRCDFAAAKLQNAVRTTATLLRTPLVAESATPQVRAAFGRIVEHRAANFYPLLGSRFSEEARIVFGSTDPAIVDAIAARRLLHTAPLDSLRRLLTTAPAAIAPAAVSQSLTSSAAAAASASSSSSSSVSSSSSSLDSVPPTVMVRCCVCQVRCTHDFTHCTHPLHSAALDGAVICSNASCRGYYGMDKLHAFPLCRHCWLPFVAAPACTACLRRLPTENLAEPRRWDCTFCGRWWHSDCAAPGYAYRQEDSNLALSCTECKPHLALYTEQLLVMSAAAEATTPRARRRRPNTATTRSASPSPTSSPPASPPSRQRQRRSATAAPTTPTVAATATSGTAATTASSSSTSSSSSSSSRASLSSVFSSLAASTITTAKRSRRTTRSVYARRRSDTVTDTAADSGQDSGSEVDDD